MHEFLLVVGFGLVTAAVLALSAVAFTLEYAVSGVANLAHGELLTVGAYAAYVVQKATGNVVLSALAAILGGGIAALLLNTVLIERFRGRPVLLIFIATLGASLVIQNVVVMLFGGADISYSFSQGNPHHVGPFLWTTAEELVIASAAVVAILLFLLLQRTKLGKALRAVAQNRELAQVSGIPARRIIAETWFIAGLIAGFSGFVLAETVGTFNPSFGFSYLLITITATVAGGLGKPYATLGGAVLLGLILEIAGSYTNASYELAFAFAALVLLVLLRPNGLFVPSGQKMVRV